MFDIRVSSFFAFAILWLTSCGKDDPGNYELVIDREFRAPRMNSEVQGADFFEKLVWESAPERLENGYIKQTFPMPPSLATSLATMYHGESAGLDPFAEPAPDPNRKLGLKGVLAAAGIDFPEGASVEYDQAKWALVVVNTDEQMKLTEAFLDSIHYDSATRIHIRAEIYEVERMLGLQLIESAAHEIDHTPERDAVLRAVNEGIAKLVSTPTLLSRSGQRSIVEVNTAFTPGANANHDSGSVENEDDGRHTVTIPSGTLFEVDPVAGADEYTLDLNFRVEHTIDVDSAAGDSNEGGAAGQSLHRARLSSTVTLSHGSYVLVGCWDSNMDFVQLVFITAIYQKLSDVRPVIKVDRPGDAGE